MLLKDLHKPYFFNDFIINKQIVNKLKNLVYNNTLSNLLLYGPEGSGKFTILNSVLNEIYKKKIILRNESFKVSLNNLYKDISINVSEFHFEILLDSYTLNDKNYLQKLIEIITSSNEVNELCKYKIIVIKNIDLASSNILLLIKKIIEKKYDSVLFFLTATNISKINKYLKGFIAYVRVPSPSLISISSFIKEKLNFNQKDHKEIDKILKGRNLNTIFINVELFLQNKKFINYLEVDINKIVNYVLKPKINNVFKIREILYNFIAFNYNLKIIKNNIINKIFKKIDNKNKLDVILIFNTFDISINYSYKNIIHIEAFLVNLMNYFNNIENN